MEYCDDLPLQREYLVVYIDEVNICLDELRLPRDSIVDGPLDLRARYLAGMKSESCLIRERSVNRLVEIDPFNVENVKLIVEMLEKENDDQVRSAAIASLARMGVYARSALPALRIAMAWSEPPWRNRFEEAIDRIANASDENNNEKRYSSQVARIQRYLARTRPNRNVEVQPHREEPSPFRLFAY
jgi:HEAT repeat protein